MGLAQSSSHTLPQECTEFISAVCAPDSAVDFTQLDKDGTLFQFFVDGLEHLSKHPAAFSQNEEGFKVEVATLLSHNLRSQRVAQIFRFVDYCISHACSGSAVVGHEGSISAATALGAVLPCALRLSSLLVQVTIDVCCGDSPLIVQHLNQNNVGFALCDACFTTLGGIGVAGENWQGSFTSASLPAAGSASASNAVVKELLLLLLSFFSSSLYSSPTTDAGQVSSTASPFADYMLYSSAVCAQAFAATTDKLIHLFIFAAHDLYQAEDTTVPAPPTGTPSPPLESREASSVEANGGNAAGTRQSFTAYLTSWLRLSSWRPQRQRKVTEGDVIGKRSLHLFLCLAFHRRGERLEHGPQNPLIARLRQWQHGETVSFALLLSAVRRTCEETPTSILLLYLLLKEHPGFLTGVLFGVQPVGPKGRRGSSAAGPRRGSSAPSGGANGHNTGSTAGSGAIDAELGLLLAQLCKMMYPNLASQPPHFVGVLYLILSCFVLLSHDADFNTRCHYMMLPVGVGRYYKEKHLGSISVGSLTVISCVRLVAQNYSTCKDLYLKMACFSVLGNMAPFIRDLNYYAASRTVFLVASMSRRTQRLSRIIGQQGGQENYNAIADKHATVEFLSIVLDCLGAALTYAPAYNATLIYELLYQQDSLAPIADLPKLISSVSLLLDLIAPYRDAVDGLPPTHTSKDVFAVVERIATQQQEGVEGAGGENVEMFRQHCLRSAQTLKYTYQEDSDPAEFFVPFIWQHVLAAIETPMLGRCFGISEDMVAHLPLFQP